MISDFIPSLASLRAFEVAARVGGFSKAAAELNVTHAAVAQHVRSLEKDLGTRLMTRDGKGMALTEDGRILATELSSGFGQIAAGVRQLRQAKSTAPFALTTTPSFAENWLMPRLGKFWATHPGLLFSITPTMDMVDLNRDPFDMAIRYGSGDWPNVISTLLVQADYVVAATPELLRNRSYTSLADLSDLPWLFNSQRTEELQWALNNGLDPACCKIREIESYTMILSGLRAGAGISVVKRVLVQDDINAGHLVVIQEDHSFGTGYYIVERPTGLSKDAKTFKRWLLSQV